MNIMSIIGGGRGVYISFSGGKDSTVLLDIARQLYPDMKACFLHTGLEFPEVVSHVKTFDNVDIIRPDKTFKQVIDEYGHVFPSKIVSEYIEYAKKGSEWAKMCLEGKNRDGTESVFRQRFKRWKFLVDSPFKISHRCCEILKKRPAEKYMKRTGLKPIIGTLAVESKMRENGWLKIGCNNFSEKHPKSLPMSFWVEQDVLKYIVTNDIKIPSIYGEILEKGGKLQLTGIPREGCVFCAVGCHLHERNNFHILKELHPKLYDYCLNTLGMKEFLDYLGKHLNKELY